MNTINHSNIRRIAFIGNYQPRQCGIATFTTDLCESIAEEFKDTACIVLPVNDTEAGYEYRDPNIAPPGRDKKDCRQASRGDR